MEHTENLGEVLFVNETTLTKKFLREFYRKTAKYSIFFIVLSALLFLYGLFHVVAIVAVYSAYNLQLTWNDIGFYVLLTIPALFVFLLNLVLPGFMAKKQYQALSRLTGTDAPVYTYYLGDRIACHTPSGQCTLEYTEVSKILDSSCGCFLIVHEVGGFYVSADGFSQGTYKQFRQFLTKKCPNLGKRGKNIVKPTNSTPQTFVAEVPDDLGHISFVNETVLTEEIYLKYYKKALRFWLPGSIFLTLAATYLLSLVVKFCALGFSPNIAAHWLSLGFSLALTALIIFLAVKYWRLPWSYTKKAIKRHRDYISQEDARLHYFIGDRFFFQSANSHSTFDYPEVTKIMDMDFGCAIVFARRTACVIRADGFTQGSCNDFRQFLTEKCPHLDKKHKS